MTSVCIRTARANDAAGIARLAALDSRRAPRGPALVALLDGELVAAIGLGDGVVVADPFRRTADVVQLLALRAGHGERRTRRPAGARRRLRFALRAPAT